jgi:hypothetical protein
MGLGVFNPLASHRVSASKSNPMATAHFPFSFHMFIASLLWIGIGFFGILLNGNSSFRAKRSTFRASATKIAFAGQPVLRIELNGRMGTGFHA